MGSKQQSLDSQKKPQRSRKVFVRVILLAAIPLICGIAFFSTGVVMNWSMQPNVTRIDPARDFEYVPLSLLFCGSLVLALAGSFYLTTNSFPGFRPAVLVWFFGLLTTLVGLMTWNNSLYAAWTTRSEINKTNLIIGVCLTGTGIGTLMLLKSFRVWWKTRLKRELSHSLQSGRITQDEYFARSNKIEEGFAGNLFDYIK